MLKFISLGCKVNSYESNALKELFLLNGFSEETKPDIVVINTCSVTAVADQKSRQIIRRERRANKDAILIVMGCYSQKNAQYIASECGADIIVGTSNRNKLVDFAKEFIFNKKQIIAIEEDPRKFK
ncbi:MAG: tRNA (N(6)-L-threonylcarbamoyladenosine(37)-C(2))-methylthiotransferase MtaB, partial [bacterium]|nr:tRNA (N(6)-L-threonylcarbamoyladenosine(37)-C(2))-methylthiotransferase MtaB [bacterium]